MPEIRLKSQNKEPAPSNQQSRMPKQPAMIIGPASSRLDDTGSTLRRHVLERLTAIQINTAGLSGPYRTDEETMERVCGNHSAVRELRVVLRRSLILPRRGPLVRALVTWALEVYGGNQAQAARSLGISVPQLRHLMEGQRIFTPIGQPCLSLVE
jgi:hypothetical protein